jgi:hypothetical protein
VEKKADCATQIARKLPGCQYADGTDVGSRSGQTYGETLRGDMQVSVDQFDNDNFDPLVS